ncbi:transcription antitermination factor NusB [Virgibacillus chiguensis]|uniref:Transcription antitermination protein NusB n=1 Tax=Virgibacillus chiguensis TaxID=411959 RepID=A0A1M5LR29_9BACI|nr:transcription antitermination factor NusB [Virgibacillus chiguensis]SHG67498.1 N utilization substance protein B [Virgibacillus chiguensis]
MNRHEARKKALQIIFSIDMNEIQSFHEMEHLDEQVRKDAFLNLLVNGVINYKIEIDKIISEKLENWSLERIASVEKAILRIAVFEIRYVEDIPVSVSINEAIELANTFGDEKSGKFINGVLSRISE